MKAADLMIGDWVVKPSGHIRTMGRAEFSNDDAWFRDTKPIPLTAEILEKNGWKKENSNTLKGANTYCLDVNYKGFDYRLSYKFSPYEYFALDSYDDRWYRLFSTKFCPKNAHELQQALRLCGLHELADNFKV